MNILIPKDSERRASIAWAKQRLKDSLPGTLDRDLHMLHAAQDAACSANDQVYDFDRSNTNNSILWALQQQANALGMLQNSY